jgi:hypothetical protein
MGVFLNFYIKVRVYDKKKKGYIDFIYNHKRENNYEIHFNMPFTDEPTPSEGSIDIYNMGASSKNWIKKGRKIVLYAGFEQDSVGVIFSGKIERTPKQYYEGNSQDKVVNIVVKEGKDYDKKKDIKANYGKGTSSTTIIRSLIRKGNFPCTLKSLKKNKVYKKGFSVDGNPFDALCEVVEACKSSIYWRRGKLYIRNIKKGHKENLTLDFDSGLTEQPEYFDDDDGNKGWNLVAMLNHRISTASIIYVGTSTCNGVYHVKSGEHSFDGTTAQTTMEVV